MQVQIFEQLSERRYTILLLFLTHMMMLTILIFPLPLGKVHVNAYNPHCLIVSFEKFSPSHKAFLTQINFIPIPQALTKAGNEKWKQAMKVEMEALENYGVTKKDESNGLQVGIYS